MTTRRRADSTGTTSHGGPTIRRARLEDEAALYDICLRTGDSGQDATGLYTDPRLLGHVYAAPYLHHAPDFAFVLEDTQGVGGYVLGAPDTAIFEATLEQHWWPPLRAEYPDPQAIPPTERTRDERLAYLIHHPGRTDAQVLRDYPAHLHIDLLPRMQGGNGRPLMQHLIDALTEAQVPGVHLGVGRRNEKATHFYRRLGFEVLRDQPWGYVLGLNLAAR